MRNNLIHQLIVLYLDYVNNYATVKKFAEDNHLSDTEANLLINIGRDLNEEKAKG
jgi:hypothetical protein